MPSMSKREVDEMANPQPVFVGVEFSPDDDAPFRQRMLPREIQPLGNTCHVMSFGWVVQTTLSIAEIFKQISSSKAIGEKDRLVVFPLADPAEGEEPWRARNAPTAAKCFRM
jgi:hypothetical protein